MNLTVLTRIAGAVCVSALCACDRAPESQTPAPEARPAAEASQAPASPSQDVPPGPDPAQLATKLPADVIRASLPPLPFQPAPRPRDYVVAAYEFAALHPEVLKYVPCYCGCEQAGHQHNESCFVASRDAEGRITEWDAHGMG
jgi:hypothetical protein